MISPSLGVEAISFIYRGNLQAVSTRNRMKRATVLTRMMLEFSALSNLLVRI